MRCSSLVLSVSSRLYWKWSAPVGSGLRDYEWLVMPTDHLYLWPVIVIKRMEFDRWPHVILTAVMTLRHIKDWGPAVLCMLPQLPLGQALSHRLYLCEQCGTLECNYTPWLPWYRARYRRTGLGLYWSLQQRSVLFFGLKCDVRPTSVTVEVVLPSPFSNFQSTA